MTPTHAARHRRYAEEDGALADKFITGVTENVQLLKSAERHEEAAASGVCNFDGCEDETKGSDGTLAIDRNIATVLTNVLTVIPDDESNASIRGYLLNRIETARYRAPEDSALTWRESAFALSDIFVGEPT